MTAVQLDDATIATLGAGAKAQIAAASPAPHVRAQAARQATRRRRTPEQVRIDRAAARVAEARAAKAEAPNARATKAAGSTGGGRVSAPKPPGFATRAKAPATPTDKGHRVRFDAAGNAVGVVEHKTAGQHVRTAAGHVQRVRAGVVSNLTRGPRVHPAVPINANGSTITVAVAGVVLIVLYRKGVPQAIWKAATQSPAKNSTPGNTPTIHSASSANVTSGAITGGTGGLVTGAQSSALVDIGKLKSTEASVASTRSPSGWLNWCLQFFDDVRSRLGLQSFYGAYDAKAVCSDKQLHSGLAPAGAGVCFSGGPNWHIGVADGGDSYTSAGLPGGVQSLPYSHNPNYLGWFA